jgi:hypothetical protein
MTGQPLAATISQRSLTVGDPLVIQLRGVLPRGATLLDRVARTRDTLPEGVRILGADTLRVQDGVVVGQLRVAFFRPDSQTVPVFAVAYQTPSGTDTLTSAAIRVLVHPVLPIGNATLRDIRDVDAPWLTGGAVVGASLVVLAVIGVWLSRRVRRVRRREVTAEAAAVAEVPSAYEEALERLREIEAAELPVEVRYARAADVVRGYIAATRGVPAMQRTTPEIVSALGRNGELLAFLREADMVKFAGVRPSAYSARAKVVLDALR